MDLNSTFCKKTEIMTRQIAGETVLVPVFGELADAQQIFMLDPVAAVIWDQLDGEKSLNHILQHILGSFDIQEKQAETDIYEFIGELLEADLIVESPSS